MATASLRCPKCQALLRMSSPLAPGKKVKCPKCTAIFAAGDSENPPLSTAVKPKASRPSVSPHPFPSPPGGEGEGVRGGKRPADDDGDLPRRRSARDDFDDDDRPRSRERSRRHEDDDAYDRPRSAKKKRGNAGLLIGVAAVILVLLLGGGGAAWWLLLRNPAAPTPVLQNAAADNVVPNNAVADNPALPDAADNAANAPAEVNNPPAKAPDPNAPKPAFAMGEMAKELLDKTTRATAFIRVDSGNRSAVGSGFLVKASGDAGYVITNFHVIDVEEEAAPAPPKSPSGKGKFGPPTLRPPSMEKKGPLSGRLGGPFRTSPFAQQPTQQPKAKPRVTVTFHSGTAEEQSLSAEVVAVDEEADLAALRITGARNLPAPLDVSAEAPVAETLPVFIFGFPMIKQTKPEAPSISIGKGSISGIRRDQNDEIIDVHINGDLNPGNSGGPVVDALGRLVGVAVATVPGKQIGFAVPANELAQMFKGRIHAALVFKMQQKTSQLDLNGEFWIHDRNSNVRSRDIIALQVPGDSRNLKISQDEYLIYVRLSDPMLKIKAANMHFAVTEQAPERPNGAGWAQLANSTQSALKIRDQDAFGNFQLPMGAVPDQTFAFQFSYVNADGQTIYTQPHLVRLTFPKNVQLATVNVTAIPDDPTRRYIEDALPKLFSGKVTVKTKTRDSLVIEIDPAPDPKAVVAKINFGEVTSVQGRTIAVKGKKLDLPLPDPATVSEAMEDIKLKDKRLRIGAADKLAKAYAPLPERRAEVAKALEALAADKDIWVGKAGLRALTVWGGPENTPVILKCLESGFTRGEAYEALAKIKDPATAPTMAKALLDHSARPTASSILRSMGAEAEKVVIPYLTHENIFVAQEACNILKEIGASASIEPLTAVVNSGRALVAPLAHEALKTVRAR